MTEREMAYIYPGRGFCEGATVKRRKLFREIATRFWPTDRVILKTADEPIIGMVVQTHIHINGAVDHTVSWGDRDESRHYEPELLPAAVLEADKPTDEGAAS